MSALVYICGTLGLLSATLGAMAWWYAQKCTAAEQRAEAATETATKAVAEMHKLAIMVRDERAASDQRARRMEETAKAAAQVEARLQSDDIDAVADAINTALDL